MRIVCAPDTLKGVLSATDAAAALAGGVRRVDGLVAEELPLGDGGEGTGQALAAALGGEWRAVTVVDALGRPVEARFLLLPDSRAVVESAEAIGLGRLSRDELDPVRASSEGLAELLLAAADAGAREIVVTLGGSATVDGGEGLRRALAGRSLDRVALRAACDVTNPLLGRRGAARVFGPQKGATPAQVEKLERRLAGMEELRPFAELPGAGAAGGLGAALAALGAELVPGIELVLEAVRFRERIEGAALVVTGEGRVDATSAAGKWREESPPPVPVQACRASSSAGACAAGGKRSTSSARRPSSRSAAGASGRHATSPSWASRSGASPPRSGGAVPGGTGPAPTGPRRRRVERPRRRPDRRSAWSRAAARRAGGWSRLRARRS
jgi:glycerate 2-kinase